MTYTFDQLDERGKEKELFGKFARLNKECLEEKNKSKLIDKSK